MSRQHTTHSMRDTSLEAYSPLKLGDLGKMHEEVLREIIELNLMGQYPTDREVAKNLGYSDPNRVRPRRHELWRDGYVVEGRRPCSITRISAHTWRLSAALKKELGFEEADE